MNIIDIISRNYHLKQLYPNGIKEISVVSFSTDLINYTLNIRTSIKPAIDIEKWGEWLKDYDTIEIELRNSFIKGIKSLNWINNKKNVCQVFIENKEDDLKKIKFFDNEAEWFLELELYFLVFQRCRVYIKNNEDHYPQ